MLLDVNCGSTSSLRNGSGTQACQALSSAAIEGLLRLDGRVGLLCFCDEARDFLGASLRLVGYEGIG